MTYPSDPRWADPAAQQPPYPGPQPAYGQQYGQQFPPQAYAPQQYPGHAYPGPPPGWQGYGYGPAPRNGAGTASLTLGIIALCIFWVPILYLVAGVPCAIIAIVQGSKGRRLAAAGWATNGGKAKAGIICGVIALVLCALSMVVGIWISTHLTLN